MFLLADRGGFLGIMIGVAYCVFDEAEICYRPPAFKLDVCTDGLC